jgi:hypothetical protein
VGGPPPPGPPTTPADWAGEFALARESATSDLERRILADDTVTDTELSAIQDQFVDCAAVLGFPVSDFTDRGGFSVDPGDRDDVFEQPDGAYKACEASWDRVSQLYFQPRRNPEHVDEATLMANCLVRSGQQNASFTADDFIDGMKNERLDVQSAQFVACASDPATAYQ